MTALIRGRPCDARDACGDLSGLCGQSSLSGLGGLGGLSGLGGLTVLWVVMFAGQAEAQTGLDFEFYRASVEPIFIQSRGDFLPPDPGDPACVICHTWQANTPLMLESLETDEDGGVHWTEAQSRRNFAVVSRLATPGDPRNSRLLQTPLSPEGGGSAFHTGGKVRDSQDDPEWQTLAEWVRTGSTSASSAESAPEVDYVHNGVRRWLSREDPEWQLLAAWVNGERTGSDCQP